MKIVRLIVLALLVATFSSCGSLKGIVVSKVDNVQVNSLEGNKVNIDLVAKVENPNNRKIKIKKIDLDAVLGKQQLGKLTLKDKVIIPKMYTGDVPATIVLELKNMLMGGSVLLSGNPEKLAAKIRITGKIRVKVGLFGKNFEFKDQTLGEIATQIKGTN
ncbi:LEA type 2 family protein [Williamwhitmania taraxaci]|uniref:Late embryogenesis abundant protein n=1 Tax=Williamwhitmania taraxaci TaxID=1640674 RepID=A0A1G6L7Y8_9BACT|nr:LEA type 2 family protein [Williamwhitmania taraxaci]SDC39409.1 Late embryogenesis abundant protein [Williamwhitmania taraxaci]